MLPLLSPAGQAQRYLIQSTWGTTSADRVPGVPSVSSSLACSTGRLQSALACLQGVGSCACRPRYSPQPTGPSGVASLPGKGVSWSLRCWSPGRCLSASWIAAHICYLLPGLDAGAPGPVFPAHFYKYWPNWWGKWLSRGAKGSPDSVQKLTRHPLGESPHIHTISMIYPASTIQT